MVSSCSRPFAALTLVVAGLAGPAASQDVSDDIVEATTEATPIATTFPSGRKLDDAAL